MQYRMLGQTGLLVSRLGFGAATFTQGNRSIRALYKVGAELAAELVAAAIDAGVTLFDTADVYADGESEALFSGAHPLIVRNSALRLTISVILSGKKPRS